MTKIFKYFIMLNVVLMYSCNSTEPEEEIIRQGTRNYNWTVDTVYAPFNIFTRIWGSSSSDVWAIGSGGEMDKQIWHFDGNKWQTDGISKPISPTSIFGFGAEDVWIGCHDGLIWHYNGKIWSEHSRFKTPGYSYNGLEAIWGDSPDNVYAVGYKAVGDTFKGLILRYDGSKWSNIDIPDVRCNFIRILRAKQDSPLYYIIGYEYNMAEDYSKIFEFDGQNIKEIYSGIAYRPELAEMMLISGRLYFHKGRNIYTYLDNKWNYFYEIENDLFLMPAMGRSIKDIFISTEDGITHYNGSNLIYIYKFNNSNISVNGSAVFDDSVFFMAGDYQTGKNIFIRGTIAK